MDSGECSGGPPQAVSVAVALVAAVAVFEPAGGHGKLRAFVAGWGSMAACNANDEIVSARRAGAGAGAVRWKAQARTITPLAWRPWKC